MKILFCNRRGERWQHFISWTLLLLIPSVIVRHTAAEKERDIQRHAERRRREEVILQIEAQLKEQGAIKYEERRLRLERELAEAVKEMDTGRKSNIILVNYLNWNNGNGRKMVKMMIL